MANSIALFKKYVDLLDGVYKISACSSVLDMDGTLVQAGKNANEIVIPKMTMDGLADYDRGSGYVSGDVSLENETVKFNYDRGRKFSIDNMDNAETAGVAFGKLSSEFIRTKAAPELDAVRFATYAGTSGIGSASATLTTGSDVLTAILAGTNTMDEAEVAPYGRILFITPTLNNYISMVDTYKSTAVLSKFDKIVEVPQSRFCTAVDLLDGTTTGEEAGGYKKDASSGKNINFMIIQKDAVIQYTKHVVNKVISPEENQEKDAWAFFYRSYGLTDVYDNKVNGIYCHSSAT